ncbi:MAG: amidohydrolase family protein [Thermotogaceae bacterium]|nr:amidohydrolase family protein [Thermotogaceae bacterium]
MYDLAIKNGLVYIKGEFVRANLYVKEGKIAAITKDSFEAKEVYNAGGKWVLPGFIDPHVHFKLKVANWTSVDDFYHGSISAAFGGITTIIDFIDPASGVQEIKEFFKRRLEDAKDSVIDYAFHSTIANPKDPAEEVAKASKNLGMASIKLFTTYSNTDRRTYDRYIDDLLALSRNMGFVVVVHAENDEIIKKYEGVNVLPKDHSRTRPTIAELSEVAKLAQMSVYRNGQLYIVHVSSGITAKEVFKRFSDALFENIILESCPHYFWLDDTFFEGDDGKLFLMTPPLRSLYERDLLRENFDAIYTIGTDHCSFTKELKNSGEYTTEIPQGIGGVEFSFVLMYTLFGEEVIDRFTENVARVYGLYPKKGVIEVGSDADVVVFDPEIEWTINNHHSVSDYNVYKGIKVRGKILSTVSKGKFLVKDGRFLGERGWGKYLERKEIYW